LRLALARSPEVCKHRDSSHAADRLSAGVGAMRSRNPPELHASARARFQVCNAGQRRAPQSVARGLWRGAVIAAGLAVAAIGALVQSALPRASLCSLRARFCSELAAARLVRSEPTSSFVGPGGARRGRICGVGDRDGALGALEIALLGSLGTAV
jgi:hypothetical protein